VDAKKRANALSEMAVTEFGDPPKLEKGGVENNKRGKREQGGEKQPIVANRVNNHGRPGLQSERWGDGVGILFAKVGNKKGKS